MHGLSSWSEKKGAKWSRQAQESKNRETLRLRRINSSRDVGWTCFHRHKTYLARHIDTYPYRSGISVCYIAPTHASP